MTITYGHWLNTENYYSLDNHIKSRYLAGFFNTLQMDFYIKRTNSKNVDFVELVKKLDAFLTIRNGERDDFFSQFNGLQHLDHVIVLYKKEMPIGCGAFKKYSTTTVEIKRMYIHVQYQGKNLGKMVLLALEEWAKELGNTRCILETGTMLPEAIRFYEKNKYKRIPNYDQYVGIAESICFEKNFV